MAGREGKLFVGRLNKSTRARDLEDVFEPYGRLSRCEVKYGVEMAYAFVDFEDRRDAEDCMKYENGRNILGSSVIVEWAKGYSRRPMQGYDECYRCHRPGHLARDCTDDRYGNSYRGRQYSPPRRRRSYSRSKSRDRYHNQSRSPDRRRRRRSPSPDQQGSYHSRYQGSRKSCSQSRSRSRVRSRSRSKSEDHLNGNGQQGEARRNYRDASPSRSRSASPN